jgi:cob(I)alamin adenosyltransferase
MKGKSTAAFGLALRAWNQGWPIGVFQFVKSAKWKVGEEPRCEPRRQRRGRHVAWHKMGEGWSWTRKSGTDDDHAANAAEGWAQVQRDLAAQTVPLLRPRRVHLPDEVGLGRRRRGRAGAARPAEGPARRHHRPGRAPALVEAADLVLETTKVKHPMDAGQKGQRGIEW